MTNIIAKNLPGERPEVLAPLPYIAFGHFSKFRDYLLKPVYHLFVAGIKVYSNFLVISLNSLQFQLTSFLTSSKFVFLCSIDPTEDIYLSPCNTKFYTILLVLQVGFYYVV